MVIGTGSKGIDMRRATGGGESVYFLVQFWYRNLRRRVLEPKLPNEIRGRVLTTLDALYTS